MMICVTFTNCIQVIKNYIVLLRFDVFFGQVSHHIMKNIASWRCSFTDRLFIPIS